MKRATRNGVRKTVALPKLIADKIAAEAVQKDRSEAYIIRKHLEQFFLGGVHDTRRASDTKVKNFTKGA